MRRLAVTLALVGMTLWTAASMQAEEPGSAAAISWKNDLYAARDVAVAENKPMLIVFGAEWCGYCKKLDKTTLSHPQMVQYINETFIPVHLDLDKERKVAEILEVSTLPHSVVLSPEADLLGRIVGYETPSNYYRKLSAAKRLQSRIEQTSK